MKRCVSSFPMLALTLAVASSAHAQTASPSAAAPKADSPASSATDPPQHFGSAGTLVLGLDFDSGVANTGLATRPVGFGVRPTLDTFVLSGLSVGVSMGFEYARTSGNDAYTVGGGPRLGYALRLGDRLAIWPKVFASLDVGSVPVPATRGSATLEDLRIGVHVPIAIALGTNVLLEFGPTYSTDLLRGVGGQEMAHVDLLGLRTGLIGWF